jgi:hypothetical protein
MVILFYENNLLWSVLAGEEAILSLSHSLSSTEGVQET